jgi:hypothetical protein
MPPPTSTTNSVQTMATSAIIAVNPWSASSSSFLAALRTPGFDTGLGPGFGICFDIEVPVESHQKNR